MVNYDGWINLIHVVLNCNGPEQVLNRISVKHRYFFCSYRNLFFFLNVCK